MGANRYQNGKVIQTLRPSKQKYWQLITMTVLYWVEEDNSGLADDGLASPSGGGYWTSRTETSYVWINDPVSNPSPTGGGTGGSTGTGTVPPSTYEPFPLEESTNPTKDIINSRIDGQSLKPCMKTILTDVQSLAQGSVGSIILKFNGSDPQYNWKLTQGTLPAGTTGSTSQAYNRTTGTVTTTFDANQYTQATDLSIARTIIHESIHAYLVVYFKIDPLQANKTFAKLVEDFRKNGGDTELAHHEEFARNFVQPIAEALRDYGLLQGYALPMQVYWDLAWGGLEGTSYFNNLSQTDRNRIRDVIRIELTGKDTSGNPKTQKGVSAGC